ncbi:hypothetical protein [Endozoicomonas arenosclerae]|uniref:hypothetical protein n=1 Tax=Endozoicomonas arenosclerae TaxID=1633495 RepID=UPI000A668CEE|nr:hypothetical protein [Endozoicomonas arenosclerae]
MYKIIFRSLLVFAFSGLAFASVTRGDTDVSGFSAPEGTQYQFPRVLGNLQEKRHVGLYSNNGSQLFISHISVQYVSFNVPILYDVAVKKYQLLVDIDDLKGHWFDATSSIDSQLQKHQLVELNNQYYIAMGVNRQGAAIGYGGDQVYIHNVPKYWDLKPVVKAPGSNIWTPVIDKYADGKGRCSIPVVISSDGSSILGVVATDAGDPNSNNGQTSDDGKLVSWTLDQNGQWQQATIEIPEDMPVGGGIQHIVTDYSPDLNTIMLNRIEVGSAPGFGYVTPAVNTVSLTRSSPQEDYTYQSSQLKSVGLGLSGKYAYMSVLDTASVVKVLATALNSPVVNSTTVSNQKTGLGKLSQTPFSSNYITHYSLTDNFFAGILKMSVASDVNECTLYGDGNSFIDQDELARVKQIKPSALQGTLFSVDTDTNTNQTVCAYGDASSITVVKFDTPLLPKP